MRVVTICILAAMLFPESGVLRAEPARSDSGRYQVIWRDGSVSHSEEIPGWRARAGRRLAPLDVTFKRPAVGKRSLFGPKNPALMVSDTTLKARLDGPYVEFR